MSGGQFIRVIRRREVLALAFGAMIGWSWVALTGNWIDKAGGLGAMLAFAVGGVAVIISVIYLTYEVRQNTAATRSLTVSDP